MLKNYARIALRNLLKYKGYSFLNIVGLAIGLACFIMIGLFVRYELSFDRFHEKADRIYRITKFSESLAHLGIRETVSTPSPIIDALEDEIPEVEVATQFAGGQALMGVDKERFNEQGIFADYRFFEVFDYDVVHGDPATMLVEPFSIVLTRSLAEKYFDKNNPIGESLIVSFMGEHFSGDNSMEVTGVVEDPPENSHFTFDYIVPIRSSREFVNYIDRWDSNSYLTYVVLRPDYVLSDLKPKLQELATKHLGAVEHYRENPDQIGGFSVQALTDIHLHSNLNGEFQENSDIKFIYLFSAISVFILLLACVNYINLTTARSAIRSVEAGVRKVVGAERSHLITQFLSESILTAFFALLFALLLVAAFLPAFSTLTARTLSLNFFQDGLYISSLLAIGIGVGIFAGSYPAFVLSSLQPLGMLKGQKNRSTGANWFSKYTGSFPICYFYCIDHWSNCGPAAIKLCF